MKYVFEDSVINEFDITIEQAIGLFILYNKLDIDKLKEELQEKKLFGESTVTSKGLLVIHKLRLDSKYGDDTNYDEQSLKELSEKLRKEFPEGKKEGTTQYWRGSNIEIYKKLDTLIKKYNFKFTEQQAINAVRKYVDSFNGNYKYMQLLKYFILKNIVTPNGTEIKSSFMEYIENENDNENESFLNSEEWNNEIVN